MISKGRIRLAKAGERVLIAALPALELPLAPALSRNAVVLATQAGHIIALRPGDGTVLWDFATQGASIMGEVARPGIYPVLGSRRLFVLLPARGTPVALATKSIAGTRVVAGSDLSAPALHSSM